MKAAGRGASGGRLNGVATCLFFRRVFFSGRIGGSGSGSRSVGSSVNGGISSIGGSGGGIAHGIGGIGSGVAHGVGGISSGVAHGVGGLCGGVGGRGGSSGAVGRCGVGGLLHIRGIVATTGGEGKSQRSDQGQLVELHGKFSKKGGGKD